MVPQGLAPWGTSILVHSAAECARRGGGSRTRRRPRLRAVAPGSAEPLWCFAPKTLGGWPRGFEAHRS